MFHKCILNYSCSYCFNILHLNASENKHGHLDILSTSNLNIRVSAALALKGCVKTIMKPNDIYETKHKFGSPELLPKKRKI